MEVKLFVSSNITGKIVEKRLTEVLKDLGVDVHLEIHHEEPPCKDGIFYTPTLIVDNQVVSSGNVLSKKEMSHYLSKMFLF